MQNKENYVCSFLFHYYTLVKKIVTDIKKMTHIFFDNFQKYKLIKTLLIYICVKKLLFLIEIIRR